MIDADVFRVFFRECRYWSRQARSKNSGGGIAPAAIAGLIEGEPGTVNDFRPLQPAGKIRIKGG
jgi:hypothetical protein